jgi:hypothetical protein
MAEISKIIPHEADFKVLKNWQTWSDRIFWVLFVCSLCSPIVGLLKISGLEGLVQLSDLLSFILIPIFFILEIVCDRYYIAAEYTRRKGFIDNSFASKLTGVSSVGYFSNDKLNPNFYKAAVNAFENCHFTYHISQEMIKSTGVKNLVFFIIFLSVAYFGADKNALVMPILQGLVSGYFLKNFIDGYFVNMRLGEVLEAFKVFFNGLLHKSFGAGDVPNCLKLIMDYETNLAHGKYKGDSDIYTKLNPTLSVEWDKLKAYYKIENEENPPL